MKITFALILMALTGCASFNGPCEPSDRKAASEGVCQHTEAGTHFAPAVDPSIRF